MLVLESLISSLLLVQHILFTLTYDHGLNRVTKLSIVDGGAGYGSGTAGDIYNARLDLLDLLLQVNMQLQKLTVDSSGTITVSIMDGGSAYGVGNTMNVVGVDTTASVLSSSC